MSFPQQQKKMLRGWTEIMLTYLNHPDKFVTRNAIYSILFFIRPYRKFVVFPPKDSYPVNLFLSFSISSENSLEKD